MKITARDILGVLNEQKELNEANEITLYSVIKTDKTFKSAKDYMDKEGWNINKITLSKLLIDANPEKGKTLVQKYLTEDVQPLVESFDVSDAVSKAATAELTKVFGAFGVNTKGAKLTKDGFGKFDVTPKNFLPNLFKKVYLETSGFLGTDKDGSVLTGLRIEYRWEMHSGGTNGATYGTFWFSDAGKLVRFNAW